MRIDIFKKKIVRNTSFYRSFWEQKSLLNLTLFAIFGGYSFELDHILFWPMKRGLLLRK